MGKTTTTINLGASMAAKGLNVAVIDLDPQGNASTGLGIEHGDRKDTTYDLLLNELPLKDVLRETGVPGLRISPATTDLSSADLELVSSARRIFLLSDALGALATEDLDLDYILIDCPPSLNLLTLNAMVASDSVLVPLQAEFFALEGLSQLMLSVREIRETANSRLRLEGVVLTMYDRRNNLCHQVELDVRENLKDLVFKTMIPRNVRLSEAPSYGMPVINYDPSSLGAVAYKSLATEIVARHSQQERA
ncbi:Chromosome (plasmid) partitioning protein ParA / Sporulation initiation inhibitor protein Soj [Litoreibacter arenae DSM 19593]|uniref:Chromosome partitioning protein ParA n=1 Tax=Litoreibacter arenae DSM 19593 TaxID=1123360 RepID=S9QDI3_9RHOB|nr:Chromosome (plasmid) partitioning protein ParA / Sporulation initiation inhibitor protein Soj [Litoreibacter arenae DSM 19593]